MGVQFDLILLNMEQKCRRILVFFVVIGIFSNFWWKITKRSTSLQTKQDSSGLFPTTRRRRPNLYESDDGEEIVRLY